MSKVYRKHVILILLLLALFFGNSVATGQSMYSSSIQHGSVDLSSVDKPIDSISLEGEWEFYKNQLLTSEQLASPATKPEYIQAPQPWTQQELDGQRLTLVNYGTYRLKLTLSPLEIGRQKALYISDIASAYKVWVDGQWLGDIGTVGKTMAEEVPQSRVKLFYFKPTHAEVEIVIQASNFTFRNEGTFQVINYGEADHLLTYLIKSRLLETLTIGGLLVIGLYHLIIFVIRRGQRSALFVGLLAVDIGVRGWIKDTYLVDAIASSMSWETIVKFDYLTGHVAYMILVMGVKQMFPQEMNRKAELLSHTLTTILILYIVFTPASVYTSTLSFQFGIMFVVSLYTIVYVCILAAIRRREGARINLIGYLGIAAASVNDVLLYQRMIRTTELLYEAIFLFVLLQAVIISYRYSRLFERNISLSGDLQQLNMTLERKVEDRTADLQYKNEELAHMHRSRTEMLANISHDMGSPLMGIQMNIQLMRDGLVNAEQKPDFVQSILEKATYIKRLNDDLFELSLLESGQFSFQFKRIQLRSYMEDWIHKQAADLANQHVELQIGTMSTLLNGSEAWIHVDALRIKQVLDNYLRNAVKFSRKLNSLIVVNCTLVLADGIHCETPYEVIIEVTDHGEGIILDDLPFIFDRFYRKIEGNANGSGLGLAIVKEIVERHHGRVGVVSTLGQGSTFSFTLPVYSAE